jgi:hypothetical protein
MLQLGLQYEFDIKRFRWMQIMKNVTKNVTITIQIIDSELSEICNVFVS